jgi:two-component system CheB/CheR fusion protein
MSDAGDKQPSQPNDEHLPSVVIGIGASAGGIAALRTFFSNAQPDTGAAYVVILHLSPDHDSRLAEVLQAATTMPVTQVHDRVPLQPDHVYVIPPNGNLVMEGGDVVVTEVTGLEQRRSPVDIFFRALADTHESQAVAVVLSGTGPNGSSGIKRIRERGGLTIAQDPAEAEYDDMPRHSIVSGVDYVLPVAAIPRVIVEYDERRRAGQSRAMPAAHADAPGASVHDVLTLLRVRTGHDFSNYKPATVMRRIERRMAVRNCATLADYAAFLRASPEEPGLLMKELLISVTNFFRDSTAYSALENRVIPRLFEHKGSDDHVRVWVAGCATGEEAYSVAMLLAENASAMPTPPRIQVFASDLDAQALAVAREGKYTDAEVADVSTERLRRFFQPVPGGHRVGRELREVVLFAHHNVIRDPPFSHLDLVACRNLLIYLNRAMQERVLETFHFALRPSGYLFLGGSETIEAAGHLFIPLDKDARIFETRAVTSRPSLPATDPAPLAARASLPPVAVTRSPDRILPVDLHQRLLDSYGAPSLVVTEDFFLVHVSEGAARFLEVAAGEPSRDLRRLAIPEVRVDLLTALHQASRERSAVEVNGVRLSAARGGGAVRLVIRPTLRDGEPLRGYFLVLFEPDGVAPAAANESLQLTSPTEAPITHLEEELVRVRSQLRATIEQYESQVEEAKASNEELQALNEELRSSAEELETSKEELQSVNEELSTVNQELKIKIDELGSTNNDFQNFINATDIGAIFLDRARRIKLFTARARDIFNLLPTDIGRKLSDITNTLNYDRLHGDVDGVLERLQPFEAELDTRGGRSYLMRILPYRTSDDHIDGVVLSFVDISTRRQAERNLVTSDQRFRLLIESAVDYAIFTMTSAGIVDSWNTGAERMFGYPIDAIVGTSASVLFTPEDRASGVFDEELRCAKLEGRASDERYHVRRDGSRLYCSGVTIRLGADAALGFAKIARDLTPQREAEVALKEAHAGLEHRVDERTQELQDEIVRRSTAQEHVTALLRKVVTAQEEQRARIARDLHDQLGQQLTALRLTLERYRDRTVKAGGAVDDDLDRAASLAKDIDAELDFLAWELRPAVLDDLGLAAALPRFLRQWSEHHQLAAEFRTSGVDTGHLSPECELTFYRVTQEALNNVVKHAHASRVDVILEHRDGAIVLLIEDDGVGFDPSDSETTARGIGIAGMRERAALCGATLEIESSVGEGTTVFLRIAADEVRGGGQMQVSNKR